MKYTYKVDFRIMEAKRPDDNWREVTSWLQENIKNWSWMPGNPGYFGFETEEDKVKFILRWL